MPYVAKWRGPLARSRSSKEKAMLPYRTHLFAICSPESFSFLFSFFFSIQGQDWLICWQRRPRLEQKCPILVQLIGDTRARWYFHLIAFSGKQCFRNYKKKQDRDLDANIISKITWKTTHNLDSQHAKWYKNSCKWLNLIRGKVKKSNENLSYLCSSWRWIRMVRHLGGFHLIILDSVPWAYQMSSFQFPSFVVSHFNFPTVTNLPSFFAPLCTQTTLSMRNHGIFWKMVKCNLKIQATFLQLTAVKKIAKSYPNYKK